MTGFWSENVKIEKKFWADLENLITSAILKKKFDSNSATKLNKKH